MKKAFINDIFLAKFMYGVILDMTFNFYDGF